MTKKRIETGTCEGDALGFYADLFSGWLELCDDCRLYLYCIISRHRNEGNARNLIRRWISDGYDVRVVKPSAIMQHILSGFSFEQFHEYLPDHYDDEVEVWRRGFTPCAANSIDRPVGRVDSG
jgi:hypothetical protein